MILSNVHQFSIMIKEETTELLNFPKSFTNNADILAFEYANSKSKGAPSMTNNFPMTPTSSLTTHFLRRSNKYANLYMKNSPILQQLSYKVDGKKSSILPLMLLK
jgi:hypothetical protein